MTDTDFLCRKCKHSVTVFQTPGLYCKSPQVRARYSQDSLVRCVGEVDSYVEKTRQTEATQKCGVGMKNFEEKP